MINIRNNTEATSSTPGTTIEENKNTFNGHGLSKFDYDLYKEEDDVELPIIRVKRISLPNNGERWKVLSNTTVVFVLDGNKLTKKEREFLRSVDGVNWMLAQAKIGINSFNAFKKELKNKMSPPPVSNKKKK